MGRWEDEHFARLECEVPVRGRDRLAWWRTARAGLGAVEVAAVPVGVLGLLDAPGVAVRHGRIPTGAGLLFEAGEWAVFLAGVGRGEFGFARLAALPVPPAAGAGAGDG
ncbi:hypothetical protein CcI6DRAFT_04792, partial [Frankia sp. CcI6]|uniref:DUF397 domain-containing protein n=1 Tax=Frankia sp. CcI6 TaxID=1352929 RepID=UPI0003D02B53